MNIRCFGMIGLIIPSLAIADSTPILINAQGLAQQDLSIRGSSYTGAGVSLNGVKLKNPYSAHFNGQFPVFPTLLSDPAVHSSLGNVSGHLVGTAAYAILPLQPQSINSMGLGTEERYRATIFGSSENIGGYIDWEKAREIDYDGNDLDRLTGGAFVQFFQNDWQVDILSASQTKRYGAQGYYGIPSTIYAEERTDDGLLFAGAVKGDPDGSFIRAGVSLREFDTDYRIPSANLISEVLSRYGSVMVEGRTLEIQNIALHLRGDLEHERVSGGIGGHNRTRGSVLLLPEARFGRFTVKGGLNSVFQSDESAEWLPQAGADFFVTDNIKLYAAYTETIQQPDFQTLYYSDPYHISNAALDLQRAQNVELGLHQFVSMNLDLQAAAFQRSMENASDWAKSSAADTAWSATDLGTLDVWGFDAKMNYLASEMLKLQLYYQWIGKDNYDVYAGLYELDYPEHLLAMSGYWQVTPEILLFGTQILRRQTDNNERSGNDFGAEASLGLHYAPRFAKNVRLSFLVENLWDSDFQTMPGLEPPDRTFSTSVAVHW